MKANIAQRPKNRYYKFVYNGAKSEQVQGCFPEKLIGAHSLVLATPYRQMLVFLKGTA
jgi:hypothetical protein